MNDKSNVNLNISFRNTEPTEAIKNYAAEKIPSSITKYLHGDIEAHLVLLVEKNRHAAHISFNADGNSFNCEEESDSIYTSIDKICTSLGNQLRRHKEKRSEHHA